MQFSWHVLSKVPTALVASHPDPQSASWQPEFTIRADWIGEVPDGGNAAVTFEFLLLGDRSLGAFHVPPQCPVNGLAGFRDAPTSQLPVDCLEQGCDGSRCVYRLALPHDRGTSWAYTLQV